MSIDRNIDMVKWLNSLIFCYGCGRFGLPSKGKLPHGWKLLYQPHPDGQPGLSVCSAGCDKKVREAMKEGPITEPLEMRPPPMPHEFQSTISDAAKEMLKEAMEKENKTELRLVEEFELEEKPINAYPLGMRLGAMVRRSRLRSGKTLQQVVEALVDDGFTKDMLVNVERGRLPLSVEQVESFWDFTGHQYSLEEMQSALVDFHRSVWMKQSGELKRLVEQTEKVTTLSPQYDQTELLMALKMAISTMDTASWALSRTMRLLRSMSLFNRPELNRDVEMAASGVFVLDATKQHILTLLENPPESLPDDTIDGHDKGDDSCPGSKIQ